MLLGKVEAWARETGMHRASAKLSLVLGFIEEQGLEEEFEAYLDAIEGPPDYDDKASGDPFAEVGELEDGHW